MTTYLAPLEAVPAPGTLRQSWLALIDKCPHSGLLYLKHEDLKSHPMMRGIVGHATVERCIKACVEHGQPKVDQHHAKAVLMEVLMENPEWVVPVSDMDALRVMLTHFADGFECPPDPLVEQRFHLEINGRVISGTIDLLWVQDGVLHIRDWKFGFGLPAQDEVSGKDPSTGQQRGAKAVQLIIYTLLASDGHMVDGNGELVKLPGQFNKIDARFVYPFYTADDGLVERGLVIDRLELVEHRDWLRVLLNRAEAGFQTGQWPAIPGSHCARCPAPRECPIPAKLREIESISPYERDPSELGEELKFLLADVDRLRGSLKAYVEQFGPVAVGSDEEWSFKPVASSRLSKKGKELRERGEVVPATEWSSSTSTRFDLRKVDR